jgi:hypothetical protein
MWRLSCNSVGTGWTGNVSYLQVTSWELTFLTNTSPWQTDEWDICSSYCCLVIDIDGCYKLAMVASTARSWTKSMALSEGFKFLLTWFCGLRSGFFLWGSQSWVHVRVWCTRQRRPPCDCMSQNYIPFYDEGISRQVHFGARCLIALTRQNCWVISYQRQDTAIYYHGHWSNYSWLQIRIFPGTTTSSFDLTYQ